MTLGCASVTGKRVDHENTATASTSEIYCGNNDHRDMASDSDYDYHDDRRWYTCYRDTTSDYVTRNDYVTSNI